MTITAVFDSLFAVSLAPLAHAVLPGDDTVGSALIGLAIIAGLTAIVGAGVKLTAPKRNAVDEQPNDSVSIESHDSQIDHPHDHQMHSHATHEHDGSHGHGHSHDDDGHGHHNHDHHDHDHDHDHPTGLLGRLKELYQPHSHDSADSVDSALESSAKGIRAVKISLAGLMATALFQVAIVALSGSVALLADTIHNFSDALTSIPLWIAFILGRRAANRTYTYGYRRAEDLSGLFIVAMIAFSAVLAGWESVRRLIEPQEVENLGLVAAAGVIGFIGNEVVAIYRIRVGRQIGSAALVADGHHARTDGLTSLAVVLGAAGVAVGFPAADPIIGLLITIAILFVLRDAARQVLRRLMDGVDPEITSEVEELAASTPGVLGVSEVRVRWVGHRMHATLHAEVAEELTVVDGHNVAEAVREQLFAKFSKLDDVTVHIDPEGGERHHPVTSQHEQQRR